MTLKVPDGAIVPIIVIAWATGMVYLVMEYLPYVSTNITWVTVTGLILYILVMLILTIILDVLFSTPPYDPYDY